MSARCVLVLLLAPGWLSAQLGYGLDVALRSRYEWRGLTRHDGWVVQPDLLASLGNGVLRVTVGAWGNVELAAPDATTGIGSGRTWLGELNGWTEVAGVAGPLDIAGGWTGYTFPAAPRASVPGGLHDTHEVYVRLVMTSLPFLVPRIAAWHDLHAIKGTYFEGGLALRVPAWTQVLIPVGSLVIDAAAGYSEGQEADPAAPTRPAYFARRGFTHLDLSAALTGGYLPLNALNTAVHIEYHVQIGWDPRTQIPDAATTGRRVKTWFGLSLSALGPRCQPTRTICPP